VPATLLTVTLEDQREVVDPDDADPISQ